MKAYLSGAMENVPDEGQSWRSGIEIWLSKKLGHTVFNPVSETKKRVDSQQAHTYRTWKKTDLNRFRNFIRQLVEHDIAAVQNDCDYIICFWDEAAAQGGGTQGEVTIAYQAGKPVYLVCGLSTDEISGWILACATELFDSFADLKQFLTDKYSDS